MYVHSECSPHIYRSMQNELAFAGGCAERTPLFRTLRTPMQLFQDCGVLDLLHDVPEGKSLMADKGFEIQDLLVKFGLLLSVPPFKGSQKLVSEECTKTQRIACVCIHVERAIGEGKTFFCVFQGVVPLTLAGLPNQMWAVACLVTKFCDPIIASKESELIFSHNATWCGGCACGMRSIRRLRPAE